MTVKSPACAPEIETNGEGSVRLSVSGPLLVMVKTRSTVPALMDTCSKSVWSAVSGVVSPSTMEIPLPETSISGPAKPWISNVNGFSSASSLGMLTVADLRPEAVGSKRIVKLAELPAGTGSADGALMT